MAVNKRFYLTYRDEVPYLYPEEWLKDNDLASDEDLKEAFPSGGRWCSMEIKSPFLMSDDAAVKAKMTEKDPETGQIRKNFDRFDGCLLSVAVTDWDLPWTPDESGWKKMPPKIAALVVGTVKVIAYDDTENQDLVDFLIKRRSKRESSSEIETSVTCTLAS